MGLFTSGKEDIDRRDHDRAEARQREAQERQERQERREQEEREARQARADRYRNRYR